MTEQAKVPAIRFAGFTDLGNSVSWERLCQLVLELHPAHFLLGNFLMFKVDDLNESSHFQFDSAQRVDANTAVKLSPKAVSFLRKEEQQYLAIRLEFWGKLPILTRT